jgi:2-polyprenyl-3-methyl-5-hydroxy-6-metoxy-1,4-benzoquinol methylase
MDLESTDPCQVSVDTFDRLAGNYARKYLGLDLYDGHYHRFAARLPQQASVLDVACGPGNVSAFLARERPDLRLQGIDLAPAMVALAQTHVPSARFQVHDCRRLAELGQRFDGIAYAFGLNYIDDAAAQALFAALPAALSGAGVLFLSTMLGDPAQSGVLASAQGDRIHLHFRRRDTVEAWVRDAGLDIVHAEAMPSPASAAKPTNDLMLVAARRKP